MMNCINKHFELYLNNNGFANMLINFFVLVRGTRPRSLSSYFSCILYCLENL